MQGDTLYDVVNYILNEASERDLEVVREALKRRVEGNQMHGAMGIDPGRMANQTAARIREQMGMSIEQIRSMVRDFAAQVIEKNAPELGEKQIRELLDSWVPDELGGKPSSGGAAEKARGEAPAKARGGAPAQKKQAGRGAKGGLAPDVILTMVTQFLSFSTESMSVSQQMRLNEEIPDWQRKYWEQFSPRIRQLLTLFVNGEIDRTTCLERVCGELGIEPS